MSVSINVNGVEHRVDATPDTPLLWVLRDLIHLTGTKFGCGMSLCGACTVLLDGQPIRSCSTPLQLVGDKKITTIESNDNPVSSVVKNAWQELAVAQCGYCQSGQIMAATALLSRNKQPSDQDIDSAMAGNICRCATYHRVRDAIKLAAKNLS